MAQAEGFQNFKAGMDLLDRIGGERDPNGIANSRPQQVAQANRRFDRTAAQGAGLGNT